MNERNVAAQHTQGNEFVFLLLFMFVDLSVFERRYLSTHKKNSFASRKQEEKVEIFFLLVLVLIDQIIMHLTK